MEYVRRITLAGVLATLILGAGLSDKNTSGQNSSDQAVESPGKHDFALEGQSGTHACAACHTPHQKSGQSPQWELRKPTPAGITPYISDRTRPDSTTLMCLGCHDGTVASDISGGRHRNFRQHRIGGSDAGALRSNGHPLGVRYPIFDAKYRSRTTVEGGGKIKLPEGRVACISCHDPHDSEGLDGMLVMSNRRSNLCLSCHRL